MALESALLRGDRKKGRRGYELKDSLASIAMGLGNLVIGAGTKVVILLVYVWLYEHRPFALEVPWTWWGVALCVVAEDHSYYWFHRTSHEVRMLWAGHVNHHSSTHYNLSTALRQSWTSTFMSWVFWAPLPLLGFDPLMVVMCQSINLLYQYWIHTELIGSMGPFGWVFNTPSHHRVHHGRNGVYLDRNHGGIFIVWDRLYGTFQRELPQVPVDYGITKNLETFNPVIIAFHEWAAVLRDALTAKTWRGRVGAFLMPPGWNEDGTGRTAKIIRAEARQKLDES